MNEEMYWAELHRRATALRQSSFYILLAGFGSLVITTLVAVTTVQRVDEYNDARPSDDSGLGSFFGFFTSDFGFLDYASNVSSATSTYAIVTVALFATGYLLRALSLLAEVAVVSLDLDLDLEFEFESDDAAK